MDFLKLGIAGRQDYSLRSRGLLLAAFGRIVAPHPVAVVARSSFAGRDRLPLLRCILGTVVQTAESLLCPFLHKVRPKFVRVPSYYS